MSSIWLTLSIAAAAIALVAVYRIGVVVGYRRGKATYAQMLNRVSSRLGQEL